MAHLPRPRQTALPLFKSGRRPEYIGSIFAVELGGPVQSGHLRWAKDGPALSNGRCRVIRVGMAVAFFFFRQKGPPTLYYKVTIRKFRQAAVAFFGLDSASRMTTISFGIFEVYSTVVSP
jgi:hypothetical protein